MPELGRYRCSREGLVYYSNHGGQGGSGYAICLQCGRTEADSDNRGLSSFPPALVGHKPLRYRKGQDLCPGNDKPFSIKRNLALGLEITTDVIELQPQHALRRAGANALVIALGAIGLEVRLEVPLVVTFRGHVVGHFRVDLLVEDRLVVEVKAVSNLLKAHEVQLVNYLRATRINVGLLLNFGTRPELRRRVYQPRD